MSFVRKTMFSFILAASVAAVGGAIAQDKMSADQLADARTKIETATRLAAIARAEKDGQMMLVAAQLLTKAGPVASPGEALKDGKPSLIDVGAMVEEAKGMGADAGQADKVAAMSMPQPQASYCYWYYSCDTYASNCQWLYIC